jgi:FKBP-type peptidyl-prolyl cis-trans isomerase
MIKILYLFLLVVLFSCSAKNENPQPEINWDKEKSTELNKTLAMEEEIQIKLFLEQHKDWKMESTGSGLQYYIYEQGKGEQAIEGMSAQVEMIVTMLDGTECYKTNSDEYEEFVIDRSNIETGVQEGIKVMKVGDKAKLIVPSHLAHGLVGDMDKIPPLTVLVVDLHLIGLVK